MRVATVLELTGTRESICTAQEFVFVSYVNSMLGSLSVDLARITMKAIL